jgi:hypothetical protein
MLVPVGVFLILVGLATVLLRRALPLTLNGFLLAWLGLALALSGTREGLSDGVWLLVASIPMAVLGSSLQAAAFRWRGSEQLDDQRALGGP